MPPMPGGGDPVGGGVWVTNYVRRTFLPGAAEGTGAVQVVRGGYGGWVYGRSHKDTTWSSGKGDMELENPGHGVINADVLHVLPGQGRPAELPD